MYFAGNDYVYLSKNKVSKTNKIKDTKLLAIPELKENESQFQLNGEDPKLEEIEEDQKMSDNPQEMKFKESDYDQEEIEDLKEELNSESKANPSKKEKKPKNKIKQKELEDRLSVSCESICEYELNRSYSDGEEDGDDEKDIENVLMKNQVNVNSKDQKFKKVVDTNILTIKFEFLKNQIPFATGDPQSCSKCKAILNSLSHLEELDNKFIWKCEFCLTVNELQIEKEEIPREPCVDFFVESSNQTNKSSFNYTDNQALIYCFDISGSMCVSYPMDKKLKIKGSKVDTMYKEMMKWSDGSDQFYETNQRNISYVSRLQCLQGAIEENINSLIKNAPNLKVGFVTFNNSVMGYGDCIKDPIVIEGNNLNNENYIMKLGEENRSLISTPIKESKDRLIQNLYSFEESGQTALGPAMMLSISLIDQVAPGSRIILCTDGIANLGLGSIMEYPKEKEIQQSKEYFGKLGNMAKEKGIIINLITFQDEESKIEVLMEMVEKTGGDIIRVNPKQIVDEFSNLLSNEIVATHVSIQIKLHKLLSFRNEKPENITENGSTLLKNIGNATKETELYVEYMFKKSTEIAQFTDININQLKEVPFQSIIEYTTPSGDKCIRVITNTKTVSNERDIVEQQSDFNIISTNAVQKTANIAQAGNLREAQAEAYAWKKFIKGNTVTNTDALKCYSCYSNNMHDFNSQMNQIKSNKISSEVVMSSDKMNQKLYSMRNTSSKTEERIFSKKNNKK